VQHYDNKVRFSVRYLAISAYTSMGRNRSRIEAPERPVLSCLTGATGRTAPVVFGALPDPLANIGQSDLRLFGQLQGIINFDAEVAHGAFELGVPKQ
jgi:hypothetical protein